MRPACHSSHTRRLSDSSVNGARGMRDIEGKATRVGASECGQRTSFKTERERNHQLSVFQILLQIRFIRVIRG